MHDVVKRPIDYLLTKLALLLGGVIVVMSLVMAALNYQDLVNLRLEGYRQMLHTLETSYLRERVMQSRAQLEVLDAALDREAIARGESAYSPVWSIAHRIKMAESHYIYFYHVRSERIDSYPSFSPSPDSSFTPHLRPWFALMESDQPQWVGPYREYGSGIRVLTLGKKIHAEDGSLLGLMMVDLNLHFLQEALERVLGPLDATLFLRHPHSGEMLAEVNPQLLRQVPATEEEEQAALKGLRQGALLLHDVPYVGWELGLYVPAVRFWRALTHELSLLMLPLGAMMLVVWMGIRSLLRIFHRELDLLQGRLNTLVRGEQEEEGASQAPWFVEANLKELAVIEDHYRSQQRALLSDPLTGIGNRRSFDEAMESVGTQENYALVLIDVDRFKLINDHCGHSVGDGVLCRVAECLVSVFGPAGCYRIGGDEFAVLTPWGEQELGEALDRLGRRIHRQRWREGIRVTLSMGVASGGAPDWFERADAALYRSKETGRDRWCRE
ncbi:sensor domain-containing diguanylate cyclase [Aeromonas schubertii]